MAGERYAKITVRAAWSWIRNARQQQTEQVSFHLAGQWHSYRRGGNAGEFVVPDPGTGGPDPRDFVLRGVNNLLALVRQTIQQRGLSYTISAARDAGDDSSHVGQLFGFFKETDPWPIVEFDVVANLYDPRYDLDFADDGLFNNTAWAGFARTQRVTTISPVFVTAAVTPALIYNSPTGEILLTATNNQTVNFTYQWDDQAGLGTRQRLALIGPRTYGCLVTADTGASTHIAPFVGSDPRLEVTAQSTDTTINLLITGGLPPYATLWDDGSTSVNRVGLTPAIYHAVITDSRGAQVDVTVDLTRAPYHWSRNPVALALDAGAAYRIDPTTKPNLSFLCEVWIEPDYLSGTFVQVGTTLEQPADRQGRTTFDVQALLDAYLQPHVPAPALTTPERADSLFRRFYLVHREQFGTPPVPAPATTLDYRYVVAGGLGFYEAAARTWFSTYQPNYLPFLTWEPKVKGVLDDQPEYLYHLVLGSPPDFQVWLKVGFTDAPDQTLALWQPIVGAHAAEVYCLPVGFRALGLGLLGTTLASVAWWEVWVADATGTTRLSETRRFERVRRRYPHRRYFLFQTSLGGMATYAALGDAQLDVEVTGEESTRTLAPGYDPQLGDVQVQERLLRPVLKVAAGKRTVGQLQASQDLLLARRVLLLSGARWAPGFLKAKTVTLLEEGKRVQVQEFDFIQPTERLYTPDLRV
jgi:hypothetical protein